MNYEPIIGVEIHAELKTKTKMFCDCLNDIAERHPNVNICPVCTGQPGALPTINKAAVEHVIRVGLAMGGEVAKETKFDRKNYFYPDLPKGYQISQYDQPLVAGGSLRIRDDEKGIDKEIHLTRIHLEEDTARMVHAEVKEGGKEKKASLVDYNRSGVPLMELVSEPDIRSADEARLFAEEFRSLLRYLDVSEADMERGEMRIEANVSVRPEGQEELPDYKVELKNINSFRAVDAAVRYEIDRQIKALKKGKKLEQETRGWRDDAGKTVSQRTKEEAHDYRYFPEPDLPPLNTVEAFALDMLKASVTELPLAKTERFMGEYILSFTDAQLLTREKDIADFYEEAASDLRAKLDDADVPGPTPEDVYQKGLATLYNYFTSDLRGMLNDQQLAFSDLRIAPAHFAELITLAMKKEISSRIAKDVLSEMIESGHAPSKIIEEKNMSQVSDSDEIEDAVRGVLEQHAQAVADYKSGKENAIQFLFGMTMRELKGRGNPETIREILEKLLNE